MKVKVRSAGGRLESRAGRVQGRLGSEVRGQGPQRGHLQVGDDAVLHILLLLAQKVEAHGVERVGAELVLPQQHLGRRRRVGTGPRQRPLWGPDCPAHPLAPPCRTCSMSMGTRPTMLTTLLSRRPVCFDWKEESRMVERRPATRPRKGKPSTCRGTVGGQLQGGGWP